MKKLFLAAMLTWAATAASAQVYGGAAVGAAKINTSCLPTYSCDDVNFGYKLYIGYQDNETTSAEIGYIDFGTTEMKRTTPTLGQVDVRARAVTLAFAFRGQLAQNLTGVARIGAASVDVGVKSNVGYRDGATTLNEYLGLGLEYAFMPKLKAALAVDVTKGQTDGGDKGYLSLLSLGMQYSY